MYPKHNTIVLVETEDGVKLAKFWQMNGWIDWVHPDSIWHDCFLNGLNNDFLYDKVEFYHHVQSWQYLPSDGWIEI
jgi:hypothetical protein